MPSFARPIAVGTALVLAALAAAPIAQAAPLALSHGTTAVADTPNDGVIAPGDDLAITETVHNDGLTTVTGLQATLSSTTPGVVVTDATKSYPNIDPGMDGANTLPFHVHFSDTLPCGTTLNFSLSFSSGAGTASVPFSLATGGTGPFVDYTGNPVTIGDATPTLRPHLASLAYAGTLAVNTAGIVKSVQVTVGDLVHADTSHLGIDLVSPNGTHVTLIDHRGGPGQRFTNTELVPGAATSLAPPTASPFTGTFSPDGNLGVLTGLSQQGTWRLSVSESNPSEIGRLNSWTLHVAPADCTPLSVARLSLSAPRINPGDSVTLDASQSETIDPGGITGYEWDLGTGTFGPLTAGPATRPPDTFLTRGHYTIRVRVSDAGGVIGIASQDLIVSQAPNAVLTLPSPPKEGHSAILSGVGSSDPEGTAITYDWDVDGDNDFDDASGQTPSVFFATSGAKTIKLRVTDADGATATTSGVLNVLPTTPPVAAISATPNPVVAGSPVAFDASASSDPDGTVVGYEWDLDGNGSFETQGGASPVAGRAYPNPTVISVGVRVTDNDGRTAIARVPLTIQAPAGAGGGQGGSGGTPSDGGGAGGGSAGGGGAGGSEGGDGGSSGGGHQSLAASLQGASIQGLKLVKKKGLGLRCSADRAATCSVTASLQPTDARKLGLSKSRTKTYVLGRATVRLTKAGAATITVRVSSKVLGKLKRLPRVVVLVTGTAVDSVGGRIALRRAVLLRR